MRNYFLLQYKMINRHIKAFGMAPVLAYVLVVALFVGMSILLFERTQWAGYIYAFLAVSLVYSLSAQKRNDFLKTIFPLGRYRLLRWLENSIIILPFLLFLLYKQAFVVALVVVLFSSALSVFNTRMTFHFSIPTPFGSRPFEFAIGFRKTFYLFPLAYYLGCQSIQVHNLNLGVFAILLMGFVVLFYYAEPENEYYVWSFSKSVNGFLIYKIITAYLFFSALVLPIILGLVFFFTSQLLLVVLAVLLCYLYLLTMILARYAAYPNTMSVLESTFIVIGFLLPPTLLGIIPFFYFKSLQHLKPILNHD